MIAKTAFLIIFSLTIVSAQENIRLVQKIRENHQRSRLLQQKTIIYDSFKLKQKTNTDNRTCQPQVCKYYEFCSNGKCLDKCAFIGCRPGFECKKAQCLKIKECKTNNQCESYQFCSNGKCLDKCTIVRCAVGFQCQKSLCMKIYIKEDQCENNNQCLSYQFCENGQCLDKCNNLYCISQSYCKKGKCIPLQGSCVGVKCEDRQECQNGVCIQKDINMCKNKCQIYETCFEGQCIDKCDFLKCANCIKGQCGEVIKPQCKLNQECGFANICNLGKCIPKCSVIKCQNGYLCKFGYCFPIFQQPI